MSGLFDLEMRTSAEFDVETISRRSKASFVEPLTAMAEAIQQRAKFSIRPSHRKQLSDLPPAQQVIFEKRVKIAQKLGKQAPLLPFERSQPGQPPFSPSGRLPRSIVFAIESDELMAVVGPIARTKRTPTVWSVLEFGGQSRMNGHPVTIAPRPFMRPALQAEASSFVGLFEGVL